MLSLEVPDDSLPMTGPAPPLQPGQLVTGPLFEEPMRVVTVGSQGEDTWVAGLVGTRSERFRNVALTQTELAQLTIADPALSYDGDGALLRLGIQA